MRNGNKKIFHFILFVSLFLCSSSIRAVSVTNYTYATTAGTYTAIAGGTAWLSGASAMDDVISGSIAIGHNFTFNCIVYTTLYISTNGFITFGATVPLTTNQAPISSSAAYAGTISAFGCDANKSSGGTPEVRYEDRAATNEFVIQWTDFSRFTAASDRISYQIRLNYSTNEIKIVYGGTITAQASTVEQPQIGLRGAANTDFSNRYTVTSTDWSATAQGTANTDACRFTSTATACAPAAGRTFTYTPPTCSYPGNVSSTLKVWLRADANIFSDAGGTPAVNADNVYQWNDQSINSITGSQGTVGNRPNYYSTANLMNFNQTILFSSANSDQILLSNNLGYSGAAVNATVFEVYNLSTSTAGASYTILTPTGTTATEVGLSIYDRHAIQDRNASYTLSGTTTFSTGVPYLAGQVLSGSQYGWVYVFGKAEAINYNYGNWSISSQNYCVGRASGGGGNPVNGYITEIITYTSVLSAINKLQVDSYLALKYGMLLTNDNDGDASTNEVISGSVKEGDYVASNGTSITWQYSANSGYAKNVTGIGRDDNTGLNQRASATTNTTTTDIIQLSLTNDFTNASNSGSRTGSFASDLTFLTWGHDNAATTFSTTFNTSLNSRMTRIWKSQLTNTLTSVYMKVTSGSFTNGNTYYLIGETSAAGTSWTNLASAVAASGACTFAFNPTSKPFWSISNVASALPIELLDFNVKCENQKTIINWSTASEFNNDYFNIERSSDGMNFLSIAKIKGSGTTHTTSNYVFVDEDPLAGVSYYRLRQTDYDGKAEKFEEAAIECGENADDFFIYPNPNNGDVYINGVKGFVALKIYDVLGNLVYSKGDFLISDNNLIQTNDLSAGVYNVQILFGNKSRTLKLVVQNK